MDPYFTINVDENGEYRGYFKGANQEIVWWTEGYVSKQGAQRAIDLLKERAKTANVLDMTEK